MTVGELKAELKKYPDDLVVFMMPTTNVKNDRDIESVGIELMDNKKEIVLSGIGQEKNYELDEFNLVATNNFLTWLLANRYNNRLDDC